MYFSIKNKKIKGFTLIELLMVVAIIGLLTSVVFSQISTVRAKARDTERLRAVQEMNNAIQLYITDNGHPPVINDQCLVENSGAYCIISDYETSDWNSFSQVLSDYIPELPTDPCGEKCYENSSDGFYSYFYQTRIGMDENSKAALTNEPYVIGVGGLETKEGIYSIGFGSI